MTPERALRLKREIKDLLDERLMLKAERDRYMEALRFYASKNNYTGDYAPVTVVNVGGEDVPEWDVGNIARQALGDQS